MAIQLLSLLCRFKNSANCNGVYHLFSICSRNYIKFSLVFDHLCFSAAGLKYEYSLFPLIYCNLVINFASNITYVHFLLA